MGWKFYGRTAPLQTLRGILGSRRWFFARIEGRRRIGKTALIRELANTDPTLAARVVYCQIPDSDERDVAATFRRALEDAEPEAATRLAPSVQDFPSMARAIGALCQQGLVVVLDEFQYFSRASLRSFNSHLQAEVDKLRTSPPADGGLFVLGSLQTEMTALLEDSAAPLYGRLTNNLDLDHWDFSDLQEVFRDQGIDDPGRWLTLWTLFEGVPKFYHDVYGQDLYQAADGTFASQLISKLFLGGGSPLSEEADTWFLRELRGKSVSILHYLAEHAGASNREVTSALSGGADSRDVAASYLATLTQKYRLVEKRHPVFSNENSRNARFYIADNFLQAWLAVIRPARDAARMRPVDRVLPGALARLETLEGHAFEKLIRKLHVEAARKGIGDFDLTSLQLGFWNRPREVARSIEVDVVALDEDRKRLRVGSCKRSESAHTEKSLEEFERNVQDFLSVRDHQHLAGWQTQRVLFAPSFSAGKRDWLEARGYECRDLGDYARWLAPG
jgi:uncharacterized protein